MSFDSLLRHSLAIERRQAVMDGGDPMLDDDGHTITEAVVVATVRGRVQPKTAREVAWASQAGPVISDHTIFMRTYPLLSSDVLIESGRRFDIQSWADAGGSDHHLEVDARLIRGDAFVEGEGS